MSCANFQKWMIAHLDSPVYPAELLGGKVILACALIGTKITVLVGRELDEKLADLAFAQLLVPLVETNEHPSGLASLSRHPRIPLEVYHIVIGDAEPRLLSCHSAQLSITDRQDGQ